MSDKKADKSRKEMGSEEAKKVFTTDILDRVTGITKTEKGKTYTILGLTFITFAILVAFAIRPTIKSIFELNRKITEFKGTAQQLERKSSAIENLRNQYNNSVTNGGYKEPIEFLDSVVIPTTADLPYLYANINKVAVDNSVSINAINADNAVANDETFVESGGLIVLNISASGSKSNLLAWVSGLEQFSRPLLIDSIIISEATSEAEDSTLQQYNSTLKIYAYYFEPEVLEE